MGVVHYPHLAYLTSIGRLQVQGTHHRNLMAHTVVKVSRGPPGPGPGSSNYPPFWPRLLVGGPRLLLQTQ